MPQIGKSSIFSSAQHRFSHPTFQTGSLHLLVFLSETAPPVHFLRKTLQGEWYQVCQVSGPNLNSVVGEKLRGNESPTFNCLLLTEKKSFCALKLPIGFHQRYTHRPKNPQGEWVFWVNQVSQNPCFLCQNLIDKVLLRFLLPHQPLTPGLDRRPGDAAFNQGQPSLPRHRFAVYESEEITW